MKPIDLLKIQLKALEDKRNFCLVSLLAADGQTPRSSGKMIVYEDGASIGTVGGGVREAAAVKDASECIRLGRNMVREYDFETEASESGESCGGKLQLFFEVFVTRPQLVMVGGGHVGRCVLELASFAGFDTLLIDDRDASDIPDAVKAAGSFVKADDLGEQIRSMELADGCFAVIASHSHAGDAEALEAMLSKNTAYVGMIGSAKKKAAAWEKLLADGISRQQLDSVCCPIGLDIGGETPEEIAVSIMAQIIQCRYAEERKNKQ